MKYGVRGIIFLFPNPPTKKYSVGCIAHVTLAGQSPGVIIIVDAVAVVAAVLEPIQQLLLIARALAPSPFSL